MEKESLINSLRERIGENDFNAISRRSVETIIEPLLPMFADDEKVTDETYALPVALLKSFIGQSRHDIAEGIKAEKARFESEKEKAVKDAVESFKATLDRQDPKPAEPEPNKDANGQPDFDAIVERKFNDMLAGLTGKDGALGKLTESFNTFITDYNAKREQEHVDSVKTRVRDALAGLGANNETIIDITLGNMSFGTDKQYEDLLAEAKSGYESLYKRLYANGPQPFAGGASESGPDASFKAYLKSQQDAAQRQEEDAKALRGKMI